MSEQKKQKQEFTPEEKLDYYRKRLTYWEHKLPKLLSSKNKARAKRRIAHYTAKIAEQEKIVNA